MTVFLRLLGDDDKAAGLLTSSSAVRKGASDARLFTVAPETFKDISGAPFAYWTSPAIRSAYKNLPGLQDGGREAQHGGSTKDDYRFLRLWWEDVTASRTESKWFPFAKGGAFCPYYADVYLTVNWKNDAAELEAALLKKYPYLGQTANWVLHRECNYFDPGLTWTRRTKSRLSMRILPRDCIFADKGPSVFDSTQDEQQLLALLSITSSAAFHALLEVQLAAADAKAGGAAHSFEVGVIQRTPVPDLGSERSERLADLGRSAWSLKRKHDTVVETSHAFVLPAMLRERVGDYDPAQIDSEFARVQAEIDAIAFDLYGFEKSDRASAAVTRPARQDDSAIDDDSDEEDITEAEMDATEGLLSWCVGVAFGRFDLRLATGQRAGPADPRPFDPLPSSSPGMLPVGAEPFHVHAGILVDDAGHPHDLARLVEEVLLQVNIRAPDNVRRWLQRDFFALHLRRYSKSRRKAPVYWPLATPSGSYTLWVYSPNLSSQTLYLALNNFIEPKLQEVSQDLAGLRAKGGGRSLEDEKRFESLQTLELELIELRDTLLALAPRYHPQHDDGVQISAAPLWSLFRHKAWQRILKEAWAKLEKGEHDWARMAMNYWPERVREKCASDKSLAIAHQLEALYVEPETKPKKPRGPRKSGAVK